MPDPVDAHVGARVRWRRFMLGVSQETLGAQVGVSLQQVKRYELGLDHIGARLLFQIAEELDAPISFFFQTALSPRQAVSGFVNIS